MKILTTSIVLTGFVWSSFGIFSLPRNRVAIAQIQRQSDLFYLYKGQRIPLNQRQDAIAVSFKNLPTTRSIGGTSIPLYQQLQQDLQRNVRSTTPPVVNPLGDNYAVVTVTGESGKIIQQSIQQQPYVQSTLPVLSRNSQEDVIILPNEIILSFDPKLSQQQRQTILEQNNLEIVRKLRFQRDRYLVKSTVADGTRVLGVANQLTTIKGVSSVTPNFVQSVSNRNLEMTAQQIQGFEQWELDKSTPKTVAQASQKTLISKLTLPNNVKNQRVWGVLNCTLNHYFFRLFRTTLIHYVKFCINIQHFWTRNIDIKKEGVISQFP